MRHVSSGALLIAVAGVLLAGCGNDNALSTGVPTVIVQGETLQAVPGNLCAVQGTATNTGSVTVHVEVVHEALGPTGVIGTSTASFDLGPFAVFVFQNAQPNAAGQPSSGVFTNNLSCGAISIFRVTAVNVTNV